MVERAKRVCDGVQQANIYVDPASMFSEEVGGGGSDSGEQKGL